MSPSSMMLEIDEDGYRENRVGVARSGGPTMWSRDSMWQPSKPLGRIGSRAASVPIRHSRSLIYKSDDEAAL